MVWFNRCYSAMEKISLAVNALAKFMVIAFLATMTLTTAAQIFFRYILNAALIWPEELNVFLMAWITFIGSSIALRNTAHIGVELFVNLLPRFLSRLVSLFTKIVILFFVILLINYSFNVAKMNLNVSSSALGISMFWPRFSLVMGGLMMFVQALFLLMRDLRAILTKEETA
ncbi:MAG TPA: TRAP transporter small permease [Desulfotomaculum sp.]|nr:TRAP transporter small permease [Desulfotomaculum sp.]